MQFTTPDADGDGFVDRASGGSDCNDSPGVGAQINPGMAEVCDDLDNDCDGTKDEGLAVEELFTDKDGDGYGSGAALIRCRPATGFATRGGDCDDNDAARNPGLTEVCDDKDNNCNGQSDEGINKDWYLDEDGDTYPRNAGHTVSCTAPGANYAQLKADGMFDCDDTPVSGAKSFPGNTEICDDVDNNCDNRVDENVAGMGKGDACASGCGVIACSGPNSVACSAPEPFDYYPDVDGDQQGSADATVTKVCQSATPPANFVRDNHQDCDDADPNVRVGGTEVCDAIDNNCANGPDEGLSCGGILTAVADPVLGGTGHDWRTVSVHSSGFPVWVAGLGGKLAVRKAAAEGFTNFSFDNASPAPNNCAGHDWLASWVDSAGNVYVAGAGGRVAKHNGTVCSAQDDAPGTGDITGMVGFESGGAVTLYMVNTEGKFYTWTPGSQPDDLHHDSVGSTKYFGIHGLDATKLLVAGESGGTVMPNFWAYVPPYTSSTLHGLSPSPAAGAANAVWMGSATSAVAVGTAGRAWRWDGTTTWTQVPALAAGSVDLSSVVTLANGDAYIVDKSAGAQLHRLTQFGWAKQPKLPAPTGPVPAKPLYDIAMTGPDNIWIVGDDGRVWHFPQ
ncbi:putative metal-binding motif-containing protein [Myxococcus stipitatus]|nr:putative metal-binding motif-containing protein [Myxococcus stipitatus]